MDFLNLATELEKRRTYNSDSEANLKRLHNFFSTIQENLFSFSINSLQALNDLFNNQMAFDNKSSYSKKFFEFYRAFEKYLQKLKSISLKIKKELVDPTDLISSHLSTKNIVELADLENIVQITIEEKKKFEISKHSYFEMAKRAEKQEANVVSSIEKESEDSAAKQHSILYKLRIEAEDKCQEYKKEHKKANDLYESNEKRYYPLVSRLKDNEESRINFIKFHFEKFQQLLEVQSSSMNDMIKVLQESVVNINIENDLKLYEEKFSYEYKANQRFIRENFLLYDIYRRAIEETINGNRLGGGKRRISVPIPALDINFKTNINAIHLERNDELVYKSLFSKASCDKKLIVEFENKLKTDQVFAKRVVDKMLPMFSSVTHYKFSDKEKFELFSQFIVDICMNSNVQKGIFDLNFALIFIAEKTFYQSDLFHKFYLCKSLSNKYDNFHSKELWIKLLELKIKSGLTKQTEKHLEKLKPQPKNKTMTSTLVSYVFNTSPYSTEDYNKAYEQVKEKETFGIIRNFILHFSNFGLDMSNCNDIILEIANQYSLNQEQISFLISFLNSNLYTVKNSQFNQNSENKKDPNRFINFLRKKNVNTNSSKEIKKACIVLTSAHNYLQIKDYISIIAINKTFNTYAKRKIYKILLSGEDKLNFTQHLKMWLQLLKYNPKEAPYDKLLEESKDFSSPFIENIKLDIARTPFENDKEKNRVSLQNILIALAYKYQSIGYCQGMNYIVAFLLCGLEKEENKEEKVFHVFSAILQKTEYGKLMENDFELMKKYFYVFERMIEIYLPEVHSILKKNNISTSYYISPWFITLYTNSHSYLPSDQFPKTLIKIFDIYIFNGWSGILRIGLCMMKHFEENILKMKFEDLLPFLINDIIKYNFFQNNNYDKFLTLYEQLKVSKGLISNLENEYEIDKKVKAIKAKEEKITSEKETDIHI